MQARRKFEEAVPIALQNDGFPAPAEAKMVLLQTADLVAPDRVYSLYKEISADPTSLISMEVICANPWTYPEILQDERFIAEVRTDARFVDFLEHYEIIPLG